MVEDFLAQGIAAVKAGNKQEARRLLDTAIRAAPNDVRAWGWFYNVCENDDERLRCVREILRIEPNNDNAKQKYDELVGLSFKQPVVAPQIAQIATTVQQPSQSTEGTDAIGVIMIITLILLGIF